MFVFTGLDEKSEEEKAELDTKQVKTWRTVNEIRKEHGEKPLENGDIILDPSYLNYIQQKEMVAQQGEMGSDEEMMGDESNEEEPDYSDYMSGEDEDQSENPDESEDYSGYMSDDEENTEKSESKLIITLED